MAKDKSKKSGGDEFARPSDAPASGDGWKAESDDNLGRLLLITPLRVETVKGFEGKDAEVVVADVVVLDEKKPAKSDEHEEVYFFGGWTKGSLKGYVGDRRVLARLEKDKSKGRGGNAAWVLEDADSDDVEVARAYLTIANDPLRSKSKADADDDEKPAKKGKKGEPEKTGKKAKKK